MLLQVSNLTKRYRGETNYALQGVDLNIQKNKIHGLLGPNGAGKTTLLNVILGFTHPTSGAIYFKDELLKLTKSTYPFFGYVPQDLTIYDKLSPLENLDFFARLYNISSQQRRSKISDMLHVMDLFDHRNRIAGKLSGGMKRRLNILAAILHNPALLIMDEPMVGVDIQSKQLIIEFLKTLNANGMTMIYTSHVLEEVEQLSHQISIMDNGKIQVSGNINSIMNQVSGANSLQEVFFKVINGHFQK